MQHHQIIVLLLALIVGSVLAQLEPDISQPQTTATAPAPQPQQPQQQQSSNSSGNKLTSLIKEQTARQRAQTTTTQQVAPSSTITPSTATSAETSDDLVADIDTTDLCILRLDGSAYKVNQVWLEEPCNLTCRCVFRTEPVEPSIDARSLPTINMRNGSDPTEIRCSLPAQCPTLLELKRSAGCQNPRLTFPPELTRCECPRASCPSKPVATTTVATTIRTQGFQTLKPLTQAQTVTMITAAAAPTTTTTAASSATTTTTKLNKTTATAPAGTTVTVAATIPIKTTAAAPTTTSTAAAAATTTQIKTTAAASPTTITAAAATTTTTTPPITTTTTAATTTIAAVSAATTATIATMPNITSVVTTTTSSKPGPILSSSSPSTSEQLVPSELYVSGANRLDGGDLAGSREGQICRSELRKGRVLRVGDSFNDECHSTCRCFEDGQIRCEALTCPQEPPSASSSTTGACLEWIRDPTFRLNVSEQKCCAPFVCTKFAQPQPEIPPQATLSSTVATKSYKSCRLLGTEIQHNERLPEELHPKNPGCEKTCTCQDGKISCQAECPELREMPPPELNCGPEDAYKASDECCPHWVCPEFDYSLQGFDVRPINATTAEVSLLLPIFAIGRRGKIELNYTGEPAAAVGADSALDFSEQSLLPPSDAHWIRKPSIRTADGSFTSPSIKYYLGNLKPAHNYWFKLAVYFKDDEQPFNVPLKSTIMRTRMPALDRSIDPLDKIDEISIPTTGRPIPNINIPVVTSATTTAATGSSVVLSQVVNSNKASQPAQSGSSGFFSVEPITESVTQRQQPQSSTPSATTTTAAGTTEKQQQAQPAEVPAVSSSSSTPVSSISSTSVTGTPPPPPPPPPPPSSSSSPPSTSTLAAVTTPSAGINEINKPDVQSMPPCPKTIENNGLGAGFVDDVRLPLPLMDKIQMEINFALQRYVWHLLVALSVMTILFLIVTYLYLKKSTRVIAPITSHQSAYDNPTFTKLVSHLLVDENSQNYNNNVIQKNRQADQASHHHSVHQMNDLHHLNGRQHLI